MKSSKQLEQEIEQEKARYESLKNRRDELKNELEKIEKELQPYRHSHYSCGKIEYLQFELERVKLIEESELLPIPIFKNEGRMDSDIRVFKVTPKRIYLRKINREWSTISEDFISKDGSGYSFKGINIPETLKVWEEYILNKK